MEHNMTAIAEGLSELLGDGRIDHLDCGNMAEDERGWSGIEVRRVLAVYKNGRTKSLIFKKAVLKERMAMKILTEQGHANTPAAFSLDLKTDGPAWMAMEDLGHNPFPSPDDQTWMPKVSEALAKIHVNNMGKGDQMPWLPHADEACWKDYLLTQISVDHLERKASQNPAFAKEFGRYIPLVQDKAAQFGREMAALYREGDSLTLTHGDLQTVDGAHIYDCSGKPYIIDFGWCYYAPFYIDLASYFTFEDAKLYYKALVSQGFSLQYGDFVERLRAAFRYNGFIYLCPSVMQWGDGPTAYTGKRLLQMLKIILTGEFPERRINYTDQLFAKLLDEHRRGLLDKTD